MTNGKSKQKQTPLLDWDPVGYAKLYEPGSSSARFFSERIGIILDLIRGHEKKTILDVGSGSGAMIRRLIDGDSRIMGLDSSQAMVRSCLKSPDLAAGAGFLCGRIESIPFMDETFDIVLAMGVLEYVAETGGAVAELARVAKRKGIVIMTMLNGSSFYRLWERQIYSRLHANGVSRLSIYSPTAFRRLVESADLEIMEIVYYDFNVFPPPFDRKMPRKAGRVNNLIGPLFKNCGEWLSSGFIVKARRK